MVQLVKYGAWYNTNVMHIDGLSTETKPIDKFDKMAIPNGSIYTEIDTGDKYMFDAENKAWHKVSKNYATLDEDGLIPLENIPPEIIERMYGVEDDEARFELTADDVQNGDVVYVNDTQIMYLVVDETALDSEDGYKEFAAGIAGKAIADEDGNNIKQTYVKKTDEFDAGKTVPAGTTVSYRGQTYTVGANAEIFNSYNYNIATGMYSHAEGISTAATGYQAHSEGAGTWASGMAAHAEGSGSVASGANSHAEGASREASGSCSHAEGGGTLASGSCSHAEGGGTVASGTNSHAEGASTIASSDFQHAEGKWNVEDANDKFAHIIGNGTADNARSNAYAVDWDGKIYTHNSATGFDINSNYLEMANGIRLYISDTEPTGTIPEGSLGIGF